MTSQAEFFDSYADRWDGMEREDIHVLLDRVVREARVAPGMDILDVGTGTGVLIPCLLKAMANTGSVRAIDISAGMLAVARSKGVPENVSLELADIETFAFPESTFDRVMLNAVFPHLINKQLTLGRIRRMLRPGGLVVISHPTGREAVNKIHSEVASVVTEDRVPDSATMLRMLQRAGFTNVMVTDEPEFYLATGARAGD